MFNLIFLDFETFALKNNFLKSREILYNGKFIFFDFPVYNALPYQITLHKITIDENLHETDTATLNLNIVPQKGILNYVSITNSDISDFSKEFYIKNNNNFDWIKSNSILCKDALYKIDDFITSENKTILIAHNGLKFDFIVLELLYKRYLYSCKLKNCFMFDTFQYIFNNCKGKKSYKLNDLYKESTGKNIINAHNSYNDTNALIEITKRFCNGFNDVIKFSSEWNVNTTNDITHIGDLRIADKLFLNHFATWPSVVYDKLYMKLDFLNGNDKEFIDNKFKNILS